MRTIMGVSRAEMKAAIRAQIYDNGYTGDRLLADHLRVIESDVSALVDEMAGQGELQAELVAKSRRTGCRTNPLPADVIL